MTPADELRTAVADLASLPGDLGCWLELALALSKAGHRDEAAKAMARLGVAASSVGQVALAVGCACWLSQAKRDAEAKTVVDAVAGTHYKGSPKVDTAAKVRPPVPPTAPDSTVDISGSMERILEKSVKAIDAAEEAAGERAPNKLAPTPLLRGLEPDAVRTLIAAMKLTRRKPRHVIVDVGQPAKALFWIARGAARVTRDGHQLGELQAGSFFGEIALVSGTTRTAKVECTTDTWLLEVPVSELERLASSAPKLARVLAHYARSRLLANVMRTSELFSRLPDDERAQLLPRFETKLVAADTKVIEKGKDNEALYVVVSGRCEVRDGDETLAKLSVGDGAGEMSLLSRKPAIADVVAIEPTVLLALTRDGFDDVAVKHPGLLAEVYKLVVEREQSNQDAIVLDSDDLIV